MKYKFLLPLLFVSVFDWSSKASAHSTEIQHRQVQAVQIDASYAGGQPMANAQVTVYAPDNPSEAWKTGTTDPEGLYTFVPDRSGQWDVRVRQAGHGDIVTISVQKDTNNQAAASDWLSPESENPTVQKVLYSAAGAWGFFGTALFLVRRRNKD